MAAGTPAIGPNFGACLDFCSEETSYPVAMGFADDVEAVEAAAGVSVAHGRFTWRDTLVAVRRCLAELVEDGQPQHHGDAPSITR